MLNGMELIFHSSILFILSFDGIILCIIILLRFSFIYLECPKILGSSYAWTDSSRKENEGFLEDAKTHDNIIPKEIAERIIDAILLKRDDFKVCADYCVKTHCQ